MRFPLNTVPTDVLCRLADGDVTATGRIVTGTDAGEDVAERDLVGVIMLRPLQFEEAWCHLFVEMRNRN
jgi:hypothetical protein